MQCQIWVDRNETTKICDPRKPNRTKEPEGRGQSGKAGQADTRHRPGVGDIRHNDFVDDDGPTRSHPSRHLVRVCRLRCASESAWHHAELWRV
jgi:hypothetical protein